MPILFPAALPAAFALCALAATALAAPPPDYGHDFVTIGDPGNPGTVQKIHHPSQAGSLGAVGYTYRLSRTEVTRAQQVEFLNAYAPFIDRADIRTIGTAGLGGFEGGNPFWFPINNAPDRPAEMSPRFWARYCNWLHNDKALTADAFESGAYDTSTFGVDDDGDLTDQLTRSAGARYWIPSWDEWLKGGYWDPNKNGEGDGGYWLFPNGSDLPSVAGEETNRGPGEPPTDVGSFPDTQTPWGLLDYSGGAWEFVERLSAEGSYFRLGSRAGGTSSNEVIGRGTSQFADSNSVGLRLASAVPAPGAVVPLALGVLSWRRRR